MGCVYDLNAIKEQNQMDKVIEVIMAFRKHVLPDFLNEGFEQNIVYNGIIISAIDAAILSKQMTKKEFLKKLSSRWDHIYQTRKEQGDI